MKSILDPTFRYTPSFCTDIRKTFARIREDLRRRGAFGAKGAAQPASVTALLRRHPQP
jgi:hypothetical protein